MQLRTTVRLEESLLEQAKEAAIRQKTTLTALIEDGLRLALAKEQVPHRKTIVMPVSKRKGGVMPGVNLSNNAELLDILEGRL